MKPIDYLKAVGAAAAVLAANMLLLVVAVFIYSQLVAPGQSQAFYEAAAPRLGQWTAPAGGFVLMALTGYVFGRRRPERPAMLFAFTIFVAYAVIDIALGLAMAPASQPFTPVFGLGMTLAALGAVAGGWLATRRKAAA